MSKAGELGKAIERNDLGKARELLETDNRLADSSEVTPPPLHWAIYNDQSRMVELLLEYGARLDHRDKDRNATPLDYAIVYARSDLTALLISHGADLRSGLQVAARGAAGAFEEYGELPSRQTYTQIVKLLERLARDQRDRE